jgi:hypothetical protein
MQNAAIYLENREEKQQARNEYFRVPVRFIS